MKKFNSVEILEKFLQSIDIEKLFSIEKVISLSQNINREIYISEEIDGFSDAIDAYIRFWNEIDDIEGICIKDRTPIKIFIDTPGGYLTETFTIIDSIRRSKTPVWTINIGSAYSGGFFIFIAGHKRFAYEHSSFLYHEGSTSNGGDANKFRNYAKFYDDQLKMLKDIVLKYTSITEEEYDKHIKDDWWFSAEEAQKHGIVDKIIKEGEGNDFN